MEKPVYEVLGLRVREERQRACLTLDELGEKAGISGAFIAHIEAGRKQATLATVAKIAEALEIAVADLLIVPKKGQQELAFLKRLNRLVRGLKKKEQEVIFRLVQTALELS
jgi:XRE family transcriptional regulator, regulator of sulfur utilization